MCVKGKERQKNREAEEGGGAAKRHALQSAGVRDNGVKPSWLQWCGAPLSDVHV